MTPPPPQSVQSWPPLTPRRKRSPVALGRSATTASQYATLLAVSLLPQEAYRLLLSSRRPPASVLGVKVCPSASRAWPRPSGGWPASTRCRFLSKPRTLRYEGFWVRCSSIKNRFYTPISRRPIGRLAELIRTCRLRFSNGGDAQQVGRPRLAEWHASDRYDGLTDLGETFAPRHPDRRWPSFGSRRPRPRCAWSARPRPAIGGVPLRCEASD